MAKKIGYTTAARCKIDEYLKIHKENTVSAKDIENYLMENDMPVNITTVYRYLEKLTTDGMVNKYVTGERKERVYQYVEQEHHCSEHLHLQCVKCGAVYHLDCGFMKEITRHIAMEHDFELHCSNSILYGLCASCRSQAE